MDQNFLYRFQTIGEPHSSSQVNNLRSTVLQPNNSHLAISNDSRNTNEPAIVINSVYSLANTLDSSSSVSEQHFLDLPQVAVSEKADQTPNPSDNLLRSLLTSKIVKPCVAAKLAVENIACKPPPPGLKGSWQQMKTDTLCQPGSPAIINCRQTIVKEKLYDSASSGLTNCIQPVLKDAQYKLATLALRNSTQPIVKDTLCKSASPSLTNSFENRTPLSSVVGVKDAKTPSSVERSTAKQETITNDTTSPDIVDIESEDVDDCMLVKVEPSKYPFSFGQRINNLEVVIDDSDDDADQSSNVKGNESNTVQSKKDTNIEDINKRKVLSLSDELNSVENLEKTSHRQENSHPGFLLLSTSSVSENIPDLSILLNSSQHGPIIPKSVDTERNSDSSKTVSEHSQQKSSMSISSEIKTEPKKVSCNFCSAEFTSRSSLVSHVLLNHKTKRPEKGTDCQKQLTYADLKNENPDVLVVSENVRLELSLEGNARPPSQEYCNMTETKRQDTKASNLNYFSPQKGTVETQNNSLVLQNERLISILSDSVVSGTPVTGTVVSVTCVSTTVTASMEPFTCTQTPVSSSSTTTTISDSAVAMETTNLQHKLFLCCECCSLRFQNYSCLMEHIRIVPACKSYHDEILKKQFGTGASSKKAVNCNISCKACKRKFDSEAKLRKHLHENPKCKKKRQTSGKKLVSRQSKTSASISVPDAMIAVHSQPVAPATNSVVDSGPEAAIVSETNYADTLKKADTIPSPICNVCNSCKKIFKDQIMFEEHFKNSPECLQVRDDGKYQFGVQSAVQPEVGFSQWSNQHSNDSSMGNYQHASKRTGTLQSNESSTHLSTPLLNEAVNENSKLDKDLEESGTSSEENSDDSSSSNEDAVVEYKCKHCSTSFNHKTAFKKHLKSHKKDSEDKNISKIKIHCKVCKKKFKDNTGLQAHLLQRRFCFLHVTRAFRDSCEQGSHICQMCKKSLPSALDLSKHCYKILTCRLRYIDLVLQSIKNLKGSSSSDTGSNTHRSLNESQASSLNKEKSTSDEDVIMITSTTQQSSKEGLYTEQTSFSSDRSIPLTSQTNSSLSSSYPPVDDSVKKCIVLNGGSSAGKCRSCTETYKNFVEHILTHKKCLDYFDARPLIQPIHIAFCFKCRKKLKSVQESTTHVCMPTSVECSECGLRYQHIQHFQLHFKMKHLKEKGISRKGTAQLAAGSSSVTVAKAQASKNNSKVLSSNSATDAGTVIIDLTSQTSPEQSSETETAFSGNSLIPQSNSSLSSCKATVDSSSRSSPSMPSRVGTCLCCSAAYTNFVNHILCHKICLEYYDLHPESRPAQTVFCFKCRRNFKCSKDGRNHVCQPGDIECSECGLRYHGREHFMNHYKKKHIIHKCISMNSVNFSATGTSSGELNTQKSLHQSEVSLASKNYTVSQAQRGDKLSGKKCKYCKAVYTNFVSHILTSKKCLLYYEASPELQPVPIPFCFQCRKKFKNVPLREKHVCEPRSHECPDCGLRYKHIRHMLFHCKAIHGKTVLGEGTIPNHKDSDDSCSSAFLNQQLNFPCLICPSQFSTLRLLMEHSHQHMEEISLVCKRCSTTFHHYNRFVSHQAYHIRMDRDAGISNSDALAMENFNTAFAEDHVSFTEDSEVKFHDPSLTAPKSLVCFENFPSEEALNDHYGRHELSRTSHKLQDQKKSSCSNSTPQQHVNSLDGSLEAETAPSSFTLEEESYVEEKTETLIQDDSKELKFCISIPSEKTELVCLYCDQTFHSQTEKYDHLVKSAPCQNIISYILNNKLFILPTADQESQHNISFAPNQCVFCNNSFSDLTSHLIHSSCFHFFEESVIKNKNAFAQVTESNSTSSSGTFVCDICSQVFLNMTLLDQHKLSAHSIPPLADLNIDYPEDDHLYCFKCTTYLKSISSVIEHSKSSRCSRVISNKIMQSMVCEDDLKLCKICNKIFPADARKHLQNHMFKVHNKGSSKLLEFHKPQLPDLNKDHLEDDHLYCFRCKTYLKSISSVIVHTKSSHCTRVMSIKIMQSMVCEDDLKLCRICNKIFPVDARKALVNHMFNVHNKGSSKLLDFHIKQDAYNKNNKSHKTKFSLKSKYCCSLCEVIVTSSGRASHFEMHMKNFIYQLKCKSSKPMKAFSIEKCPVCKNILHSKRSLKSHLARHRLQDIMKPMSGDNELKSLKLSACPYCKRWFKSDASLQFHIVRSHKGKIMENGSLAKDLSEKGTDSISDVVERKCTDQSVHCEVVVHSQDQMLCGESDTYVCKLCTEELVGMTAIRSHLQLSHNVLALENLSDFMLKQQQPVKISKELNDTEQSRPECRPGFSLRPPASTYLACHICESTIAVIDYRSHLTDVHSWPMDKMYTCKYCNLVSPYEVLLSQHQDQCVMDLECHICYRYTNSVRSFSNHLRQKHDMTMSSYVKSKFSCSFIKINNDGLRIVNISKDTAEARVCLACRQEFTDSSEYRKHLASHLKKCIINMKDVQSQSVSENSHFKAENLSTFQNLSPEQNTSKYDDNLSISSETTNLSAEMQKLISYDAQNKSVDSESLEIKVNIGSLCLDKTESHNPDDRNVNIGSLCLDKTKSHNPDDRNASCDFINMDDDEDWETLNASDNVNIIDVNNDSQTLVRKRSSSDEESNQNKRIKCENLDVKVAESLKKYSVQKSDIAERNVFSAFQGHATL